MLNIHITLIASGPPPRQNGNGAHQAAGFYRFPAANDGHHILAEGDGQLPEADFLAIKNRPFNINLTEMRFWRKLCQPLLPYSERASGSSSAWRSPRRSEAPSPKCNDLPISSIRCIGAEEDGFDAGAVITIRSQKEFTIAFPPKIICP
jgi:hypothetical protein